MTLAIVVFVPEGIVMASDSRQSITIEGKTPEGKDFKVETVNSDAIFKTFLLERQRVGISCFGQDQLGGRPVASHIKSFIESELTAADDVETISQKLLAYFRKSFPDANTGFHIAGYKSEGRLSVPHVYVCQVSRNTIEKRNIKPDGSVYYGAIWSGEIDILVSILNPVIIKDDAGKDKVIRLVPAIIWDAMSLQDAIDFSIYAIQTTIDTMRFQPRKKTVGGPIDVLLLTPEEARFIQKKEIHGKKIQY